MVHNIKDIKASILRDFRQDGLDILTTGICLAIIAVFFINIKLAGVFGVATVLFILLPPVMRKKYTYPRMGYAKFPATTGIFKRFIYGLSFIIVLASFAIIGKTAHLGWLMPPFLGVLFFVFGMISAHKSKLKTEYAISVLFLVSGIIGLILTLNEYAPGIATAVQLWILAIIMISLGLARFLNFLNNFPAGNNEVRDDK